MQTIFRIRSCDPKRENFPQVLTTKLTVNWPTAGSRGTVLLDGKNTVSTSHSNMVRGAPQGNEIRASERFFLIFMSEPLQIRHVQAKFAKLGIRQTTLRYQNSMSNKFSQTPGRDKQIQHTLKPKLTDGYRKRFSGFGAMTQNLKNFPQLLATTLTVNLAHRRVSRNIIV